MTPLAGYGPPEGSPEPFIPAGSSKSTTLALIGSTISDSRARGASPPEIGLGGGRGGREECARFSRSLHRAAPGFACGDRLVR